MAVVRSDMTKGMVRDMYDWYFEQRDYAMKDTVYDKIIDLRDVTGEKSPYAQSTSAVGNGKFAEVAERESIPAEDIIEGFTTYAKYRKFGKRIEMSEESVDDHTKTANLLKETVMGWADSEQWTLENFYSNHFNKGGFTAGDDLFDQSIPGILTYSPGDFIYDSKPLFVLTGNNHTSKGGATYFNSLNVSLDPANLETAMEKMSADNNRNERDEIINLGSDYVLVVPEQLRATAERIVKSDLLPGSDTNDINVLRDRFQVVPWNNISTATSWYIGIRKKGIRAYKRKNMKIDFYYDEETETFIAKGSFRYGCMIQNFRFWLAGKTPTS